MKFKVIESNDYSYDVKDKNVFTATKLYNIMMRVKRNPKRMTFNPVERYYQQLYSVWNMDKDYKLVIATCLAVILTSFFWVIVFIIENGGIK